jgi:type III restriction enzyme
VRSAKDVEQLLGRVLRMPFAKRRSVEALNRAYAHLSSPSFSQAAQQLTDKLVNMGFEAMEVPSHLQHGYSDLFGNEDSTINFVPEEPPLSIELPAQPVFREEHADVIGNITVSPTETGTFRLEAKGMLDERVAEELIKLFQGAERQEVRGQIEQHNARVEVSQSPSQRNVPFAALPQLCLAQQGELELLEPEAFLFLNGDWSPLDFPVGLPGFALKETDTTFEVDMEGKHIVYHVAEEKETYNLNLVASDVTETDMVRWLDRQLRRQDVTQAVMIRYLSQLVAHLIKERGITLTALVRGKFLLVRAIQRQLALLRDQVADRGFQQALFEQAVPVETSFDFTYRFEPGLYPARIPYYRGRYKFAKHYYPVIEDLKGEGEEFDCAVAIDNHPAVKHWVRNLVDRPHASFRLPLSGGWFYPDFVAELHDGRLLVVEYKGEAYKTNDDSREKNAVGQIWAEMSGGRCLFLMAVEQDEKGQGAAVQIDQLLR